jgi:predicted negative regulator of RcsB-dependent stress response
MLKGGRFLTVIGPSGSGKSSLVRAGLLPQLRAGALPGSDRWRIERMTPGVRPLVTLAAMLTQLCPGQGMQQTMSGLRTDEETLDLAVPLVLSQTTPIAPGDRLVLVVDQFEELFTLCQDEAERSQFLANLIHAAVVPGGQCIVVITLRADFYHRCADSPTLATQLAAHQFLVSPLAEDGLRQAIEAPALLVGLRLEAGLLDTILADVAAQPGALPLFEHALLEVWHRRRGSLLTLSGYQASGGVQGAISRRAEEIFNGFDERQQAIARRALVRLTQPGDGTEDTRRRATLDELVPRDADEATVESVVNALVQARLLTASREDEGSARQIDVAHEALIRGWPRLKGWLDEDREGMRIQHRLTDAALEWDHLERDSGLLYRGRRLEEAEEWARAHGDELSAMEDAFLVASAADRDREIEERQRQQHERERRRRGMLAGLSVGLVTALVLLGLAGWQWQQAERERERAARRLTDVERLAFSMLYEVNGELLGQKDDATRARKRIAVRALPYLDRLAAEVERGADVPPSLALNYLMVARIEYEHLKDRESAKKHAQQSLTIAELLAARAPGNGSAKYAVRPLELIGDISLETGDRSDAQVRYRRAIEILQGDAFGEAVPLAPDDLHSEAINSEEGISLSPALALSERRSSVLARMSIKLGDLLRSNGDSHGALEQYQRALTIRQDELTAASKSADDGLSSVELQRLAIILRKVGQAQWMTGDREGAVERFRLSLTAMERVVAVRPDDANSQRAAAVPANDFCWYGSLVGQAIYALGACEKGVRWAPGVAYTQDSRGLARALTGDLRGAADDFRAYVVWAESRPNLAADRATRQGWIAELEAGRNPFDDPNTLEDLRKNE